MLEIVSRPQIRITDLTERFQLSRRQVEYRLGKVNDWLTQNQLPPLRYDRSTGFLVDQQIVDILQDDETIGKADYYFSDEERKLLILLMVLSEREDLSLLHLTSRLAVSRNTVLQDLKRARLFVHRYDVRLEYSRRVGYTLHGDEWNVRWLLNDVLSELLTREQGSSLVEFLLSIESCKKSQEIHQELENIEQLLDIRYIDERLAVLPYFFTYLWIRIRAGYLLPSGSVTWKDQVLKTAEYQASHQLFAHLEISEQEWAEEQAYVTVQLLTTNLSSGAQGVHSLDHQIAVLTDQVIKQFETIACVSVQDQTRLAKQLFQHLKPATYRIMCGIKLSNPVMHTVMEQQPELHHLVKKAMGPFVDWMGQPFSEEEYAYVTMHFGSWLKQQGDDFSSRLKAVVVCPKGVAISNLLNHHLKEMFPDILFLDTLSVRNFYAYAFEYDMVFSTVFVHTTKSLYMVRPLIDHHERLRLYREVMQEWFGFPATTYQVNSLMELIGTYANISDQQGLEKALQQFLSPQRRNHSVRKEQESPVLADLLTKERIQFTEKQPNWEEAIWLASQPLLNSGSIKTSYVEAMIHSIREEGPYVVITPRVAIPHARPEAGVQQLSMSMLVMDQSVLFGEEKPVNLIFILAAIDNETHLKALAQLTELLSSEQHIDQLIQANDKQTVFDMIHRVSKGDERQ